MAENGPFGTPFLTPQKIPPKKVYVAPFLLSQEKMGHINFFSGGEKWGVLGGGHKAYVEKVYVASFGPLPIEPSELRWAKIANRQSLAFSERGQLSSQL